MNIGSKIISWRRQHGLTQKALAEKLEISSGMLSQIEKGKKELSPVLYKKLKDITNIDVSVWENNNDITNTDDYLINRNDLREIDKLFNTLIDNKFVKKGSDIHKEGFKDAIFAALEADLNARIITKKNELEAERLADLFKFYDYDPLDLETEEKK